MNRDLAYDQLGSIGPVIGSEAGGTLHELPQLRLPDVPGPLVYLEYGPGGGEPGPPGLDLRANAGDRVGALDALGPWPVRRVVDSNWACGLVLPRSAEAFCQVIALPDGRRERAGRDVRFLFLPPQQAQEMGIGAPSPAQRLAVCRDFAAALRLLHEEFGATLEATGATGMLFRVGAEPTVALVNRVAVAAHGAAGPDLRFDAAQWCPPEGNGGSVAGDCYRLGLFVLRCLTADENCATNKDPAAAEPVLDASGMALLRAAVEGPADRRPSADRWRRYLNRHLGGPGEPPRLTAVSVPQTAATGDPVTLTWAADDAETVTVSAAGCPAQTEDARRGTGRILLYPTLTSRVTVVVRNQHGEDCVTTEPVAVFGPPAEPVLPVPMPSLPPLPTPVMPSGFVPESILTLPAVPTDSIVVPPVAAPSPETVAGTTPAGARRAVVSPMPPPPRFEDTLLDCPVEVPSLVFGTDPEDTR